MVYQVSLFILLISLIFPKSSMGTIQVFPTSLILVNENNKGSLTVRNTSMNSVEYKIVAVFYEMDKRGSVKELNKDEALKAPKSGVGIIKYSPKKISLGPKEEQVVRLILDIPKSQTKNNYRLHLKFTPTHTASVKDQDKEKISFALNTRLALAINVIYFGNSENLQVSMSKLRIEKVQNKEFAKFMFSLNNKDEFTIGKLQVIEAKEDKTEDVKKTILGFSSYVKDREVEIELNESERCSEVKRCLIRFTPHEMLNLQSVELTPTVN